MIVTISGSMTHMPEMEKAREQLQAQGYTVHLPEVGESNLEGQKLRDSKPRLIKNHFEKIKQSDALLVVNHLKNGIEGYIGGNTFLEMGMAYALGKPIYLLNPIPDLPYTDEIYGLEPVILDGNLDEIRRT